MVDVRAVYKGKSAILEATTSGPPRDRDRRARSRCEVGNGVGIGEGTDLRIVR